MNLRTRSLALATTLLLAACGGGGSSAAPAEPVATVQEEQCRAQGWQRLLVPAEGLQRLVLWKAPAGAWARGAIVVMHGGGGAHTNFCVANVARIAPQVRFTEAALAQGFAVFLLDSTDRVTDTEGRLCGKVWDDEVRNRPNLDLPFIEQVVLGEIPVRRPAGSATAVFLTGLSSGGFMTVRAATRLGPHITAFAPVASGDPYGWTRDCTRRAGDRPNVAGIALDSETLRPISEPGACSAAAYPNEKPWDGAVLALKPPFRALHHEQDGILDRSCVDKQRLQLRTRGYPESAPLTLQGGSRSAEVHDWQDDYNAPLLAWFASFVR
jgi:poly(3-hydroxybutyrate) depolymerase